jgi:hypothetical protein
MNERIRELAEQATTYIEPTSNSGEGWIFDKEKFAELIVEECIVQIQLTTARDPQTSVQYRQSVGHIHRIRQHFGIE